MDRDTLLQHLAETERHIAQGEKHVTRQEVIVAELDRDGHRTDEAKALLATMRQTLAVYLESRTCILRELDKAP
jgi:hypothetical protein